MPLSRYGPCIGLCWSPRAARPTGPASYAVAVQCRKPQAGSLSGSGTGAGAARAAAHRSFPTGARTAESVSAGDAARQEIRGVLAVGALSVAVLSSQHEPCGAQAEERAAEDIQRIVDPDIDP